MAAPRMRRRASSTPDFGRVSRAVQRPGIDPRVNLVVAWVDKFYFDADHGAFVDVTLQTGEEETARVGCVYAGPGFGLYLPLQVDDEVLLAAPMGNNNAGLVVVSRLHSASDPPPPVPTANQPVDLLLLAKKDANVRLQVVGGGNLVLIVENGKVLLGAETGTQPAARKTDPVNVGSFNILGGVGNALTGIQHIAPDGTVTNFSVSGVPPPLPVNGAIKDGSKKVESA